LQKQNTVKLRIDEPTCTVLICNNIGRGPQVFQSFFLQRESASGWTDGRNLLMDVRWAAGNADRMRMFAKELVDLQPDVILANSTPVTAALCSR
jgi:hypothetical protein